MLVSVCPFIPFHILHQYSLIYCPLAHAIRVYICIHDLMFKIKLFAREQSENNVTWSTWLRCRITLRYCAHVLRSRGCCEIRTHIQHALMLFIHNWVHLSGLVAISNCKSSAKWLSTIDLWRPDHAASPLARHSVWCFSVYKAVFA